MLKFEYVHTEKWPAIHFCNIQKNWINVRTVSELKTFCEYLLRNSSFEPQLLTGLYFQSIHEADKIKPWANTVESTAIELQLLLGTHVAFYRSVVFLGILFNGLLFSVYLVFVSVTWEIPTWIWACYDHIKERQLMFSLNILFLNIKYHCNF